MLSKLSKQLTKFWLNNQLRCGHQQIKANMIILHLMMLRCIQWVNHIINTLNFMNTPILNMH